MLVTNPRRINHEQLRILARNAKGGITHIYLHWTAGTYEQVLMITTSTSASRASFTSPAICCANISRTPGVATVAPLASLSVALRMQSLPTNAILCLAHIHPRCYRWNRWRWLSLSCVTSWNWKSIMIR